MVEVIWCKDGISCNEFNYKEIYKSIKNEKTVKIATELLLNEFRKDNLEGKFTNGLLIKVIDIDGTEYSDKLKSGERVLNNCWNSKILNIRLDQLMNLM